MIVLNFTHPLNKQQRAEIEQLVGQPLQRIIEVAVQVAQDEPLEPQIVKLVEQIGLTSVEWQTLPLIVNLPGYAPVAACLLAEMEGRRGHLPSIIKLRPVPNAVTTYEVAEIINLQALRDTARLRR